MKVQNFYPKQVMRKLAGRCLDTLDPGEKAALSFFVRKGRKFGMAIDVINEAKRNDLLAAGSKKTADVILANTTSCIFLKEA